MAKKTHASKPENDDALHISKNLILGILVVICIILLIGGYFGSQWMERKNAAAFVNDEVITLAELDKVYDSTPLEYKLQLTKRQMLDKLIENEILYQEAQKEGIALSGAAAEEAFAGFVAKNNLNEMQLQTMLDTQGVTKKEAIENYARQLTIQKYLDERFFNTLTVSDEDIKKYYENNPNYFKIDEQVTVRHILITDATKEESKAHAQKILSALTDVNFCDYVRTDSKDKASVEKCGEYTFSRKDSYDETFKTFSFNQANGKRGIVETKFGYHIIWTVKKTPARTLTLEETQDKIKKYLLDQKAQDAYEAFYNALADDYTIEILYEDTATQNADESGKASDSAAI